MKAIVCRMSQAFQFVLCVFQGDRVGAMCPIVLDHIPHTALRDFRLFLVSSSHWTHPKSTHAEDGFFSLVQGNINSAEHEVGLMNDNVVPMISPVVEVLAVNPEMVLREVVDTCSLSWEGVGL